MTRLWRGLLLWCVAWAGSAHASFLPNQVVPRDGASPVAASVYLPPGYDADGSVRYPLLVLLHGLGGEDRDWQRLGHIDEVLDAAIKRGILRPVIAVMPDGHNGYWTDWPVGGVEHAFGSLVDPVVTHWAERTYRTNGQRIIAGVSMGGFGALSVALRDPARWVAALSFSGALFTRPPLSKQVYWAAFGTPGVHQVAFQWINPLTLVRLGQADHLPIWLDCGAQDQPKFTDGLKAVSRALEKRHVDHKQKMRPGRHEWAVWNRAIQDALPWVEAQLQARGRGP